MLNFLGFMFFSTMEGLAVYALALYIFRFDFRRFLWHALIIIEIINFQNYLIREKFPEVGNLSPIVNLLITVLFFRVIARIPIVWSALMVAVGYAGLLVTQASLLSLFFSVEEVQADPVKAYIIQFLTGVIGLLAGWLLYRKGIGFSFNFERFRFKSEQAVVVILIVLFIVLLGIMMYFLNAFASLIGFIIALLVFLFYSLRKEQADDD